MMLEPLQYLLGAGSGVLVGFILGLIGGGGSVLAVPLMVYLVGVPNPHVAIGTSAFAVGGERRPQSGEPCARRQRQLAMRLACTPPPA